MNCLSAFDEQPGEEESNGITTINQSHRIHLATSSLTHLLSLTVAADN